MTDHPSPERVKRKTVCNGCRFANWDRTEAGRLHPSGYGRCTFTARYPIPASSNIANVRRTGYQIEVMGATIQRLEADRWTSPWLSECPVREPA